MALTELAEAPAGRSDPLAERAGIALEFAETDPDAARFPFRGMCRAEQAHDRRRGPPRAWAPPPSGRR